MPARRPVAPADIPATVFSALGYEEQAITYNMADSRPTAISDGEPTPQMFG
jgi:hypothetical protein